MTTIKAGDVWVANIPFSTGADSKKRPILILWLDGDDVIAAAITSSQPRTRTDLILDNWVESGLRIESTVRLSRLVCLEKSLLRAKIGRISETDAQNLRNIWDILCQTGVLVVYPLYGLQANPLELKQQRRPSNEGASFCWVSLQAKPTYGCFVATACSCWSSSSNISGIVTNL